MIAPVADKALAERLAVLMALGDHESSSLDDRVNLSIALRAAHRSGQLITLAEADARVAAERERCVKALFDRAEYLADAQKWGGSKQYLLSLKGGEIELRSLAAAIRAAALRAAATGTKEGDDGSI